MTLRASISALLLALAAVTASGQGTDAKSTSAVERGRLAVRGQPPFHPPLWSLSTIDNLWKQWGVKEKPADYARALRDRYGLHPAPYENNGLPMGLHLSQGLLSKGLMGDCLMCHASTIAGQTIIGLGNSSLELQGFFDDMTAQGGLWKFPVRFSHVRGTLDPVSTVAFLMEMRDADLNIRTPIKLDYVDNVCSDPPAWWLLKKKTTRNWTGSVDARAARIDMVNILGPFNDANHVKKQEPVFADMHKFVLSTESPKYPFAVDASLAAAGRKTFNKICATCHGTYGPDGKYPNKLVPLGIIGTDPVLAGAFTQKNLDEFNRSWLAQEPGPDGKPYVVAWHKGYQAPPLDGVWATAPYFHNGSVPTIHHVLNSKARPKIYTRSYGTGVEDYDAVKLGWKITELPEPPRGDLPGIARRAIYDTTLPGRGNMGHTFGDDLTNEERTAVIEYLKTL